MNFADPIYLTLLIILPPWLWWRYRSYKAPGLRFSDTNAIISLDANRGGKIILHAPFTLRLLTAFLIIIALARPQTGYSEKEIVSKGIDIVLALDLSSSMSATDLHPNRLAASKRVIAEFIGGRKNDRIGLVVFAAQGYTQCPLTLDYPVLLQFLENSYIGLLEDGTAIGMALATAANRLKDSDAKSKIVILLTDGMNNRGAIDPLTAAQMAKALGVKVYTIGAGKEGIYTMIANNKRGGKRRVRIKTEIDEKLLTSIATTTGGLFYRARDAETLAKIYQEIDRLEKTDIKTKIYVRRTDWFFWFLTPALFLVLIELVWPLTPWRVLP